VFAITAKLEPRTGARILATHFGDFVYIALATLYFPHTTVGLGWADVSLELHRIELELAAANVNADRSLECDWLVGSGGHISKHFALGIIHEIHMVGSHVLPLSCLSKPFHLVSLTHTASVALISIFTLEPPLIPCKVFLQGISWFAPAIMLVAVLTPQFGQPLTE
jgi:hypothetical protein